MHRVNLLDCTFRDGGYYNNWDFEPGLVQAYLDALGEAKVDAIEMGFRFFPQKKFLGPNAYTTDAYLRSLRLPKGVLIGVMVNAADLVRRSGGPSAAVDQLFTRASRSPVGLVRVAAHLRDLDASRDVARRLKALGYQVGFNLMQSGGKSPAALAAAARTVASWKAVDVLYFADSFGNMDAASVTKTSRALASGWKGALGFHAHNNMSQGLTNSLAAQAAGVAWLDGTILGMGRGAGNVQTECLLVELARRKLHPRASAEPVFSLVLEGFRSLHEKYRWGPNLLYYLSAVHGIHPTYIQVMLGKTQYKTEHLIQAIETLRRSDASDYSNTRLEQALFANEGSPKGTWSAAGWAQGRSVLLVAAGPSLASRLDSLALYIRERKPLVVSLNAKTALPPQLIDAYAACHKVSLLLDAPLYNGLGRPLFCPRGALPAAVRRKLKAVEIRDYGVDIRKDSFSVGPTECVIPSSMAAAYAMAVAEAGGAREILLAGFDGYSADDYRQHDMNHMLRCYQARPEALPLSAVTPTTYELEQGSIYAPNL